MENQIVEVCRVMPVAQRAEFMDYVFVLLCSDMSDGLISFEPFTIDGWGNRLRHMFNLFPEWVQPSIFNWAKDLHDDLVELGEITLDQSSLH